MKAITALTFLFMLGALFISVGAAQNKKTSTVLKPLVVMSGADSRVKKPRYQRIVSQKDWTSIWANHLGTNPDDAYRPHLDVDFDRCMVVVIFRGEKVNVRGIDLDSSSENKDSIVLRIDDVGYQTSGDDNNKRPDRPYAFVVLPKSSKRVVLGENNQQYKDHPPQWKEFARLEGGQTQLKN